MDDPSYHAGGGADFFNGPMCLWDWQTGEHCEPRDDGSHDAIKSLWDYLNQDDDELLGLLGNHTALRDYCDFFADLGDMNCKATLDLEESRESKRQRTLEYPSGSSRPDVGSHETGSPFVTSEVAEVSLLCTDEPASSNCNLQYISNNFDTININPVSNEAPNEQEDNHLEHCSYGTPVHIEPDQVPCSRESIEYNDDQAGTSGTSEIAPMTESFIMQETRKLSTLSKGTSTVKGKQNTTTSVAYPFTFIKPSWAKGNVTLQDLNKKIHAPRDPGNFSFLWQASDQQGNNQNRRGER